MYRTCNPTPEAGDRNVFCPYYDHCLDQAVDQAWKTWHCSQCAHKVTTEHMPEGVGLTGYSSPYYTIPLAIERMIQEGYV